MWLLVLIATVALTTYYLLGRLQERRTEQRYGRQYGTKPPVKLNDIRPPEGGNYQKETMKAHEERQMLELLKSRHEAGGYTFQANTLGGRIYNTSEPENIKAVLATKFEDYYLGYRLKAVGPFLGKGNFTTDGKEWEFSRALVRPNFVKSQVSDLALFEKHVQQLLGRIPKDGATIDMQALFNLLTFDISSEFVFGESVRSLTAPKDSEQARFVEAFDYASHQTVRRLGMGPWLFMYSNKEFKKACKTVHNFADKLINNAKAQRDQGKIQRRDDGEEKEQYIFIQALIRSVSAQGRLRSELLNILQAGRDTTSALLAHVFWTFARRPDVWAKVEAEVKQLDGKAPTYEQLKSMQYLRWTINETLRLYPVNSFNSRVAVRDTILPVGGGPDHTSPVFVPKGQKISFPSYVLHRRKDIYGPDANEFRPERWADPHFRPGWAYIPFSGGPRICVGQSFALTEAGYIIARLVQAFRAIEKRDENPYKENINITVSIFGGVNVGMIPR